MVKTMDGNRYNERFLLLRGVMVSSPRIIITRLLMLRAAKKRKKIQRKKHITGLGRREEREELFFAAIARTVSN